MAALDQDLQALLDAPSAAVLGVYRADGTILISPVWFRAVGEWIEMVVAEGDAKLERLRADPRCVFMAFATTPPFAGIRISADAALSPDGARDARLAIASRYLGAKAGARYVDQRTRPGIVVRLPRSACHSWDLRSMLPDQAGSSQTTPAK